MSLKKWERDVLNRQRNIVFPDTNLNEGRFYRNIASGKAVSSWGQKVSLLIVPAYYLTITFVELAGTISQVLSENKDHGQFFADDLWIFFLLLWGFLFSTFLAVKGLFPIERKRIVRGGYRSKQSKRGWYRNHL
ncbi:MAG: hypothetical protein JWM08_83 [Candidatus Angelobacter sp.]|nr:hypothetical protein [Candidatus Angelobacter sp.]